MPITENQLIKVTNTKFTSTASTISEGIGYVGLALNVVPGVGTLANVVVGAVGAVVGLFGKGAEAKFQKELAETTEKANEGLILELSKKEGATVSHNNDIDKVTGNKEFSIEHNHRGNDDKVSASGYGTKVDIDKDGTMHVEGGGTFDKDVGSAYKQALAAAMKGQFTDEEKAQFKVVQEMIGDSSMDMDASDKESIMGAIAGLQNASKNDLSVKENVASR